jgi:tripartite-type tricarboxylate transporter receptor subunit TctC
MRMVQIRRMSLAAFVFACGVSGAFAEDTPSYYLGKTITIIDGGSPGSIYDVYARLLARYLGGHIPGKPSVVVSDMPGADGETAAAYVARRGAKDGTVIAATTQTQPLQPILRSSADMNYDPSEMSYLGNAASDVSLCIIRSDAPVKTFSDAFKTQIVMGGTAPNGPLGYLATALNRTLGTKFKQVLGYPGSADIFAAIQRGEIQGMCGISWANVVPLYADLISDNVIKVLVQVSDQGLPDLNRIGVPLTASFVHDDAQRRILEIIASQGVFARPYFMAKEVPSGRLAIMRRAFMESWRDPELAADAAKVHLNVAPMSGEDIQALLRKIYSNPPAILRGVREAIKMN